MSSKLYAVAVLTTICWTLFVAGTATPVVEMDTPSSRRKLTLWETCVWLKRPDTKNCVDTAQAFMCTELDDHVRAARAFAVFTTVFGGLVMIWSVIEVFWPHLHRSFFHKIFAGLNIATLVSSFLTWPVAVSIYTGSFCGSQPYSNIGGASMGASQPLYIVGWLLWIIIVAIECAMPGPNTAPPQVTAANSRAVAQEVGVVYAPTGQ